MKIDKLVEVLSKNKITNFLFKKLYYFFIRDKIANYRNKSFLMHSEEILKQAKLAMNDSGVFFWVEFGTLLGIYRDNDFIKDDSDIDIGVYLDDYSPKIEDSMRKFGFIKVKQFQIEKGKYGLEETYSYKGIYIDIFYFARKNNLRVTHSFAPFKEILVSNKNKYSYKEDEMATIEIYMPEFKFKEILFKEEKFNIPEKTKEYLAYHYGDDFMIPRSWNYKDLINDHKNAILIEKRVEII